MACRTLKDHPILISLSPTVPSPAQHTTGVLEGIDTVQYE